MKILRDISAVAELEDPALRELIEQRIREIGESVPWEADTVGYFIVVEPGDRVDALEAVSGCSILAGVDGSTRFGDPDFSPRFEWLDEHAGYYEAVWIMSDDGFGIDFFIPKQPGIDRDLLALCAAYAAAPPVGDTVPTIEPG